MSPKVSWMINQRAQVARSLRTSPKLERLVSAWRRNSSRILSQRDRTIRSLEPFSRARALKKGSPLKWGAQVTAAKIGSFAGYTFGNTVAVIADTGESFQRMWDAVDSATRDIYWVTYICKDDPVGQVTVAKLTAAAQRGVSVTLLYDDGGNLGGRGTLMASLVQEPRARVLLFKPMVSLLYRYYASGMSWRYSPGIRNHRKILVVDGQVGFVGGLNIGAEYAGKQVGGNGRFRDTLCCVRGPCVADLMKVVRDTLEHASPTSVHTVQSEAKEKTRIHFLNVAERWRKRGKSSSISTTADKPSSKQPRSLLGYTGNPFVRKACIAWKRTSTRARDFLRRSQLHLHFRYYAAFSVAKTYSLPAVASATLFSQPSLVQILASNSLTRQYHIQSAYWIALHAARRRVWITTPYFLPSRNLFRAVLRAARRGVEVRILTGSWTTTDPWFMWYASQYVVYRLLYGNIQVYEYESHGKVMHAKTVVIDGVWCSVGSFNWDILSNRILEATLVTPNYHAAQKLEEHFLEDLKSSRRVTLKSIRNQSTWVGILSRVFYTGLRVAEWCTFWKFPHREVAIHFD